jgi:hypothetical protein
VEKIEKSLTQPSTAADLVPSPQSSALNAQVTTQLQTRQLMNYLAASSGISLKAM